MKRTALKRKKPMRRALPRRVTLPGVGSDPAYLAWVREQRCLMDCDPLERFRCSGRVHAHHAGKKRADRTAIALCFIHHGQWHDANGYFKGWNRDARRAWAEVAIQVTQRRHDGTEASE